MSAHTMKRSTTSAPAHPMSARVDSSADPLSMLREEMNELMNRLWGCNQPRPGNVLAPALDVAETENAYSIRVDLPGMQPKNIDIQVQGNLVRVSGHREEEKEEQDAKYHCIERHVGSFSRTVTLPCEVNQDEVAAEYVNGVLTVMLPKSEQSRTKKINVRT